MMFLDWDLLLGAFFLLGIVKKVGDGWAVFSKEGKKLSRVYADKKDAKKRLKEIEYLKKKDKNG